MLDELDRRILDLLQHDARITNAAIAEQVGLSAPSVYERIKKLEARGVIKGYTAIVAAEALGLPITAFIRVTVTASPDDVSERRLIELPEVLECHHVAGEDCYILKVKVANPQHLERLLARVRSSLGVARTVSMIVLSTAKEDTKLPMTPELGTRTNNNRDATKSARSVFQE
jgi:Lrp/AsnC family leucine-responsive transcriptional regulator